MDINHIAPCGGGILLHHSPANLTISTMILYLIHFIFPLLLMLSVLCISTPAPESASLDTVLFKSQDGTKATNLKYTSILQNHRHKSSYGEQDHVTRSLDLPISVKQAGFTGERCTTAAQCAGSRACQANVLGGFDRCIPTRGLQACSSIFDCINGEFCVNFDDIGPVCISDVFGVELGLTPERLKPNAKYGLTGDQCSSPRQCVAPRTCQTGVLDDAARCVTDPLQGCNSPYDCVNGEGCLTVTYSTGESITFCASEHYADEVKAIKTREPGRAPRPVTVVVPTTDSTGAGPTTTRPSTRATSTTTSTTEPTIVDPATPQPTTSQQTTRQHASRQPTSTHPISTQGTSTQLSTTQPTTSGIEAAEGTAESADDSKPVSETAEGQVPENGEEDNPPCIGVHSLKHLSRAQLIFKKDVLANVLCDESGSCATPGHMVRYQGRGMMMKSYCELVGGCIKRVMWVNSPRYGVGVTVPSSSQDMIFTAFSARYLTRGEEGLLAIAIRLGW